MNIVCPYAGSIAPETRGALDSCRLSWRAVDVSASDTAYTHLLASLWAARETFIVVEHDIVPPPRALADLASCDEPWCALPYRLGGIVHAGLGCVKFTAGLLVSLPDAVAQTWAERSETHPPGHWCSLDHRLSRVLYSHGIRQHVHQVEVKHLNPQPSHGCTAI